MKRITWFKNHKDHQDHGNLRVHHPNAIPLMYWFWVLQYSFSNRLLWPASSCETVSFVTYLAPRRGESFSTYYEVLPNFAIPIKRLGEVVLRGFLESWLFKSGHLSVYIYICLFLCLLIVFPSFWSTWLYNYLSFYQYAGEMYAHNFQHHQPKKMAAWRREKVTAPGQMEHPSQHTSAFQRFAWARFVDVWLVHLPPTPKSTPLRNKGLIAGFSKGKQWLISRDHKAGYFWGVGGPAMIDGNQIPSWWNYWIREEMSTKAL